MNLRNPVQSISSAMLHAIETGLHGVPSEVATRLLGPGADGPRRRRPYSNECHVVMFAQAWRAAELGFRSGGAEQIVEGETVVVIGPEGDACVYFAGRFVYHVSQPNRRFFLAVAAQAMDPALDIAHYDGRDDEQAESVECTIQMDLARLCSAVRHELPARAALIADLLRSYAADFDKTSMRAHVAIDGSASSFEDFSVQM